MRIFRLLICLVLLSMPFGELFRLNLGNDIFVKPLDVLVGLTAFIYLITYIKKHKQISNIYLTKPLLLFFILAAFSLLINAIFLTQNQLLASFLYLLRWASYSLIFFVFLEFDKKFNRRIYTLLLVSGAAILCLGYIQYFLYGNLRNLYYLGWDEHNYRMFSIFLDPNFAGAFFVLYLIFLLGFQLSLRGGTTKQSKITRFKDIRLPRFFQSLAMTKVILGLISALTIIAIFLTYSRSAILMLTTGGAAFLILINKKKFIPFLISGLVIIILIIAPSFNTENTNLFRITSSVARIETYGNALKFISDHPIFGVGFNTYRYTQQIYGFRDAATKFPSHGDAGVDSSLLFVTATTGLVGLAAYLYIWFKILQRAFYLHSKSFNKFAIVVISSAIGLFFNSLFINSLFFPTIMLWMWMLAALMEKN